METADFLTQVSLHLRFLGSAGFYKPKVSCSGVARVLFDQGTGWFFIKAEIRCLS